MADMRHNRIAAAACLLPLALAACSTPNTRSEDLKAARFTAAVRADARAPHMTIDTARSLYGNDGGTLCAALADNPAGLLLGWGRATVTATPQKKTAELVEYDRDVVKVYCPQHLADFNNLMNRLNY
ncbi:hypothetical protein [Streptomyces sp. NPDC094466]|uniref:hypothetical protein n=1 Tax=Streptomyces sp. NPDC094466 TaxID=3366065 RepID=UPI003829A62E